MPVERAHELAFQLLQLLHQPGATARWQKEGIGGCPKAAADPESTKGFDEHGLDRRGLLLQGTGGAENDELGHMKCRQPVRKGRPAVLKASARTNDERREMIVGNRRSLEAPIPMKTGSGSQESGTRSRRAIASPHEDLRSEVRDVL